MSFLSFNFAIFLGLALLIFHLSPSRWRPGLLLGFSYAFYLSWSVVYTFLLAGVTIGIYGTALWIERRQTEQGKRAVMALGVTALLVLLFAFKAAGWLLKEFSHTNGLASSPAVLVLVPLGLSYYVFKILGYLLDVYWEVLPAQRNFVSLALYASFFPQIVSGPIQRAQSFFDQIDKIKSPDADEFLAGLRRILFGLFKKIVIADRLGVFVANVHANISSMSPLELLAGAYCFSLQLYTDFSGITDIAIGIGQLFGIKGPENFDLPFFSSNIQMFWRRWHMSLTTWLTDYLFTPLRMSLRRLGTAGLCLSIFANMVAIGLWHGLTWSFLAFGVVNGVFMVVSVLTLKERNLFFQSRPTLARIREFAAPIVTFNLVALALVFFRAETFQTALAYLAGLVPGLRTQGLSVTHFNVALLGMSAISFVVCILLFLTSEAVTWSMKQQRCVETFFFMPGLIRQALYSALIVVVLMLFKGEVTFIYAGF